MIYKLTMQGSLLEDSAGVSSIQTLKRWREEGKIDLVDANPAKGAVPISRNPEIDAGGRRRIPSRKIAESGKANFKAVAAAIFPGKDPLKLDMTEINNVAHLIKHHASKNEIFVTADTRSFIEGGRRESLKAQFGILAMTPDEAVRMLCELQGWSEESSVQRPSGQQPKTM